MMRLFFLIIFLLFSFISFSQNYSLELAKEGSNKTKVIKENRRVIITTNDGIKQKGKIGFIDPYTITIKGNQISINNISEIKKNQLFYTLSYLTLGSLSIITAAGLAIPLLLTQSSLFPIVAFLGGTYTYIITSSLLRKKYDSDNWTYKIVTHE